jgi:hypothetical protein
LRVYLGRPLPRSFRVLDYQRIAFL